MTETSREKKGKPSLPSRAAGKWKGFIKGCGVEFRKIIWPGRETAAKEFAAVICVAAAAGVIIALIDFGAQNLVDALVRIGSL